MSFEDNPKSIKYYIKRYILQNKSFLSGKKVVDFPTGNGVTSRLLAEVGAVPVPFDLFPEYFQVEGLTCAQADIQKGIPLPDAAVDMVISQEGIEHFQDQMGAFVEFNRVLKNNGVLLLTTPNYSNLQSRLSYFLSESEKMASMMPPNELDSVWMSKGDQSGKIYYGHLFLIGIQRLRTLAVLSGFKIKKVHFTRAKRTSCWLMIFYPVLFLFSYLSYRRRMRKNNDFDLAFKQEKYGEIFRLMVSPKILVSADLMVEFEKTEQSHEVAAWLKGKHKEFGLT